MKITTENLDQELEDSGLLLVARIMEDDAAHKHQLRKTDTVCYDTTSTYDTVLEVMCDVNNMEENVVALIHKYPHRPTQKYVVKYGEVL